MSVILFTVIRSIKINFDKRYIAKLCVLSDGNVAVCGEEGGKDKLKRFDQMGDELSCAELDKWPRGMTEVTLNGEAMIALSYR